MVGADVPTHGGAYALLLDCSAAANNAKLPWHAQTVGPDLVSGANLENGYCGAV